jgi:hypothetical protein
MGSSIPIELNRYYSIPGKDSLGFTILQSFPDASLLKAMPSTKSDSFHNPVARVELWKKDGLSEEVYLYPVNYSKRGGQWNVPGSNLLLTVGPSHRLVADACKCSITFVDSMRHVKLEKTLHGNQRFAFNGNIWGLEECDPNGLWVNLGAQKTPGRIPRMIGVIFVMLALAGFIGIRVSGKKPASLDGKGSNE